jgi:hypothetical protein
MAALMVKDAYGINEPLLLQLAQGDPTYEKAYQIWQKAKLMRFDSLTQEQMDALEAIEMDIQEYESSLVYSLF